MDAMCRRTGRGAPRMVEPAALPPCRDVAFMQENPRPAKAQFRGADRVDDALMVAER